MDQSKARAFRYAIYTRKSSEERRMTPIIVPLWSGWALKTGHKGGHFALLPGHCRNTQTGGGEGRI
jgi:hypothetical protein